MKLAMMMHSYEEVVKSSRRVLKNKTAYGDNTYGLYFCLNRECVKLNKWNIRNLGSISILSSLKLLSSLYNVLL